MIGRFSKTKAALAVWDRYYTQWECELDSLIARLSGTPAENNEAVLRHFDTGRATLCSTVGAAFAADTADVNVADTVLTAVFGRGLREHPTVPAWVRELAA